MKCIKTTDAVGHVLCHDITRIVKDVVKDTAFRKGHIVQEEDIPVLLSLGKDHLYVWEKDENTLHENEAAQILCDVCINENMHPTDVKEGKIVCQAEGENAHIEYAQGSGTKKVNDLGQEYRKTAMEAKTPCTDILVYIGNPAANPYANTSPLQTAPFYEGNEVGGTSQNPFGPKPGFGAK